ncbi:MAG: hypothetical protein GXC76_07120 [Rhodanobacteraceae bacterium]|jgi:hypothetical protein|nr:hypothetical protein [Rhodanobacteraceae bacterium]
MTRSITPRLGRRLLLAALLHGAGAAALPLDDLPPELARRLAGPASASHFGASLAAVGDFDGDGYLDIAIGAPSQARGGAQGAGAVYVVYGTSIGIPSPDFDDPQSPWVSRIESASAGSGTALGVSLAATGDIDGDGRDDLAIGSALGEFGGSTPGKVWIVRGRPTREATIDVDADTRTTTLTGEAASDGFGLVLAGGGDLNGDGRPDLAIGAVYANGFNGSTYVLYGSSTPPASIGAAALDGAAGVTFSDSGDFDLSGISLALGGDVNGDGIDDLVIGALGPNDAASNYVGGAYVVFGRAGGWGAGAVDLQALAAGQGTRILGSYYAASGADSAGSAVAILRDQNGDHIDEIVVADPDASPLGRGLAGAVGVVYGSSTLPASLTFADLDGQRGYQLFGAAGGDKFGSALAHADVNGDGIDDLAIAAVQRVNSTSLGTGRVFVHFGRSTEIAARDMAPWLGGRGYGELYTPGSGTVDFGELAGACRATCPPGARLLLGAASDGTGNGTVYVLERSDRIFADGAEP